MTHEKIFGLLVQRQSLLCQLRSTSISRQGWGWGGLEASFCLHTTRHWNIHKQRERTRSKRQRHKQRDRRWSEQVLRVSLVSSAPVRDNFLQPPNLPSPNIALSICQVFHSVTFGRSGLVRQDINLKIAGAVGWGQNFDWNFFRDQMLDLWQTSQDTALAIIISHNFRFLPGRLNLLLLLANHPCPACHLQAWTHSHKRVVVIGIYSLLPANCLHYNLGCNCPIRLVCKC